MTLTGALALNSDNTIQLAGGTLTDSTGITLTTGGAISGQGTINATINGAGTVTASGGTLDVQGAVSATTATNFTIAAGATLELDAAVGTASIKPSITFGGSTGLLNLTSPSFSKLELQREHLQLRTRRLEPRR